MLDETADGLTETTTRRAEGTTEIPSPTGPESATTIPDDAGGAEALPEHVAANRAAWDVYAERFIEPGERSWRLAPGEERWGIFGLPESELRMLPDDLDGKDAIELGCGTAYVSAWLTRRGARAVGIDNSPRQLETAARLQREHGLDFPILLGNAERVPYPDASFDFAISEYGAVLWADPEAWVPEAARLLRPGGRLHVLTNAFVLYLASPDDEDEPPTGRLLRPQFGSRRMVWPGETSVEFHPTHGDWIRLFVAAGFEILELLEPQTPAGATSRWMPAGSDWATKWPAEEIWKVRKRG